MSAVYNYLAVTLFLYMGVIFVLFQASGTLPISILAVKISNNRETIDEATSLSIGELKLSIPGSLFGFIFESFSALLLS